MGSFSDLKLLSSVFIYSFQSFLELGCILVKSFLLKWDLDEDQITF